MHALSLPRRPEELDADWVAAMLRQAGLLPEGTRVAGVDLQQLGGEGRGYLSGVYRLRPAYLGDSGSAPASFVVKTPTTVADNRALGLSFNAYERELRFYREIAPGTPLRVPHCYFAAGTPDDYALLAIEDASDWRPGDQVFGLSLAEVEATVDSLAGLHAQWWEAPGLQALDWVPESVFDAGSLFAKRWPGFLAEYAHFLSAEGRRLGEGLAASGPAMERALGRAPRTLAHCDSRADNLLFDGPEPDDRVMLLDWQMLCRTMAAIDPARLVSGSLETALPCAGHRALVRRWLDALERHGVRGYGEEEAWRDYRVGVLHTLYWPVCFHGFVSHEGARAVRFLEAQIHRSFRTAEECRALAALAE